MTLEQMKQLKNDRGYSTAQLSERSGVPIGTLQKIFSGQTKTPRYATRQAIERALLWDEGGQSDGFAPASETFLSRSGERDALKNASGHSKITYQMDAESGDAAMVCESAPKYGVSEKKQGMYTVEDYYALPDERRVELIDGVIYDMSAPGTLHQWIDTRLFFRIQSYIMEKGGDCIPLVSPLDVRLDCDDKTMVQPDLVILCDRTKIKGWGVMGAPDFVLEVISKSTRKKDYTKKLQKYADAGVREYWIVDPLRKALVTYAQDDEYMPHFYPLTGKVGVAIYGGDLQIDLDEMAETIQAWPE